MECIEFELIHFSENNNRFSGIHRRTSAKGSLRFKRRVSDIHIIFNTKTKISLICGCRSLIPDVRSYKTIHKSALELHFLLEFSLPLYRQQLVHEKHSASNMEKLKCVLNYRKAIGYSRVSFNLV